jgi:protein SCO1/2
LTDQNGAPITEAAFKGHPSVLFFGFTHCPEVCPTTLFEIAGWLKSLGDEGKDLHVFFVSVDPERDTPDVMKGYTTAFTDRITGITGNPEEVAKVLKGWRIYAKKVPTENGDYTMDHTASVLLLDRDARLKSTIDYKESDDVALKKLRLLIAG